jgi:murein DD-endopeptidase MepM/ murein hydrolase activator NlpD
MLSKIKTNKIINILLTSAFISAFFFTPPVTATEYTINDLNNIETWQINQDINGKRSEIQELTRQIGVYKKNITAKQRELTSLSNQVSTLNESIGKINLEVDKVGLEMETLDLKIENTELKIQAKEREIEDQKETVAEIIRTLHRKQQDSSMVEILLLNDSFSDFLTEIDHLENMQDSLVKEVEGLNEIKIALNNDKDNLKTEVGELDILGSVLEGKKGTLDTQKSAKYNLMSITEGQEANFQALLEQTREEQEQINNDIVYLEQVAREKLNRELQQVGLESNGLMWPVSARTITAYFHDPDYPYRWIFEHPAIDIAVPQGTPLRAAESGYVAKVKDGGQTGYSYIMIVHANNLSTVYGHVNQFSVSVDQFVSKGQIIGYSGGMPGTRGAGPLSSGPHLHFETRINGVPVNPLNYLP